MYYSTMYKKSENKKKLLLQQQYFNNTLDWKKNICSVCTTCFCSGCGFGRVDAFLIQGYLRETYLPIGGPKLYKLKGSKTLVVSLQDRFPKIGFFWIWELLPRGQNKGQLISVTNWMILFWLSSTTFLIWPQKSLQKFRWYFGRNDDTKMSFWN